MGTAADQPDASAQAAADSYIFDHRAEGKQGTAQWAGMAALRTAHEADAKAAAGAAAANTPHGVGVAMCVASSPLLSGGAAAPAPEKLSGLRWLLRPSYSESKARGPDAGPESLALALYEGTWRAGRPSGVGAKHLLEPTVDLAALKELEKESAMAQLSPLQRQLRLVAQRAVIGYFGEIRAGQQACDAARRDTARHTAVARGVRPWRWAAPRGRGAERRGAWRGGEAQRAV